MCSYNQTKTFENKKSFKDCEEKKKQFEVAFGAKPFDEGDNRLFFLINLSNLFLIGFSGKY
jgi:hypothetical protein